jgi:predicted nucleic acid-binding protein
LQSLSEFYAAVTRKRLLPAPEAAAQVNDWLTIFPVIAASANAVRIALVEAVSGRASYWDALLIATAAAAGCRLILTEDLADGTSLSGVEIHNPFDPSGGLTPRTKQLLGL